MEVSSWENHLFLWAIYTMAMVNNQVRIVLPRLSHLTAHITIQANSMGLIPKTGEQHLIENNNINHNNKTTKQKKLKQPKQYNRL
jgi:hypothetical protein